MVRLGMAAAALALMAAPLFAQESEQLKKELQDLRAEVDALKAVNTTKEIPSSGKAVQDAMAADDNPVMTLFKQTKLSGFVDAGYQVSFNHMHKEGASTNQQTGTPGDNPIRIFDDRSDSFYLNAVQLNLERLATKDMIVGYHIELAAGHDPAIYDTGTVALQEGWLQILAPLGDGLDIRVGKMAMLCGYEVIESVNNMNYSRGMLFGIIQPFTSTGIRASYWFGQQFGATLGFSNGINNALTFPAGNDTFSDDDRNKMVEFQVAAKPIKDLSISATLLYTHESNISLTNGDGYYLFDLVVSYTMDKLTLALNFDKSSIQGVGNSAPGSRGPLSGIALYAKYAFTDTLSEALRIEYFSDQDGVILTNPNGSRVLSVTATTEMKVAQQLILRMELRADNSNDRIFGRGGGSSVAGTDPIRAARGDYTLGFEAIMPF
jgi:hypothetical protein